MTKHTAFHSRHIDSSIQRDCIHNTGEARPVWMEANVADVVDSASARQKTEVQAETFTRNLGLLFVHAQHSESSCRGVLEDDNRSTRHIRLELRSYSLR